MSEGEPLQVRLLQEVIKAEIEGKVSSHQLLKTRLWVLQQMAVFLQGLRDPLTKEVIPPQLVVLLEEGRKLEQDQGLRADKAEKFKTTQQ